MKPLKTHSYSFVSHAIAVAVSSLALLAIPATAQAPLDVRVALIIGNSAYAGNMALVNPANDAKAMADVLKRLGFTVIELRDGNKAQMAAAIAQVSNSLKGKQGVIIMMDGKPTYMSGADLANFLRNLPSNR